MKIAYDIEWDVDNAEDLDNLPKIVQLPDSVEDVADYLSDKFEYCVSSFLVKEVKCKMFKLEHQYTAAVTHEVTYRLPENLTEDEVKDFIRFNSSIPCSTEATDEDFLEDGYWAVLDSWEDD